MLFIELMAEMKRPFDFWKGMVCAQVRLLLHCLRKHLIKEFMAS
jgi:hypothetical protein